MTEPQQVSEETFQKHSEEEMERYASIEARLAAMENSLLEIKDVWSQAKGALQFIKILAGIATAIAAVYAFLNTNFTITPK